MDLHALSRRDLQALSKRNGIRANQTNAAMADALAALPKVDGIEEYVQQPVTEPASAAEPAVQAVAEEEEAEEEGEKEAAAEEEEERVALTPDKVIVLDDSEEEEEKAPALDVGRRRATRRAPVEPVAAPATSKRAAARKTEKGDAAAEAVPARATRGRSQRTVAEEEAPKASRRTSRRAVTRNTSTEQEEQEKGTQGRVSDVEAAVPAPASSDEGDDGAAKMETAMDAQNEEQFAASEAEKGDASAVVVPARATRAGSRRTVVSFAEEAAPKTRRTSRRAVARKTSTEQEEGKNGTNGDVSDMETAAPAPVSSYEMEVAMDAHNEEQNEPVEAEPRLAVPARTTRDRSKKKVVSFADEEAPKSRRAVARKTSTEQEEKGNVTQGDVCDIGAAVSAPASSGEGGDGAEEIEATIDAQNEKQFAAAEAVPARVTRVRRQRTVVSVAVEDAPKARRTSRRTSTMQEEKVQGQQQQQDIASDVEAVVPAPVSSDEGGDGAEETEADMEPQNEEQNELVEEQSEEDEGVVADRTPLLEEEPVAEDCAVDSSVEEQTDAVSSEEIQHSSQDKEIVPAEEVDFTGDANEENEDAEEEPAVAEHVDSSVQQHLVNVQQCEATEEIQLASEDAEMVPVNEVRQATVTSGEATVEADFTSDADHTGEENEDCTAEEEPPVEEHVDSSVQEPLVDVQQCEATEEIHLASEDCTAEEEPAVAEHVDSSVQEHLVDVQQCEATEEIHLASEDAEMVPVNEVRQATVTSGEATVEADFTSDADHTGEENEDCTAEEEPPVEEHVDSSVQEPLVDVQQCEATEEIHLASEDCTAEEEPPVEEHVDSSVQEPLVDVQQCEATEEIHLASEDAEMVPVNEVPQAAHTSDEATQEADHTSDADHDSEENEDCTVEDETPVADDVDSSVQELPVEVQQCEATEEIQLASEDCPVEEELLVAEDVQQCEATEDGEDTEMVLQATLKSSEVTEEVDTSDADEMNEVQPTSEDQSAAKASENKEDIAADEVTNQTDVAAEEESAHASEENEVPNPEDVLQSAAKAIKEKEDMVAVEVQQLSEAMYEEVVDVVTVDKDDSGFIADLTDVFMDEEAAVAADEMPQSSATMEENVEEVVTVENLPQVTDDEWAVTLGAWLENLSRAKVTEDEGAAKEVVTVDNLSQATLTDVEYLEEATVENLSQAKESGVTGDLQPAFDAARDFSDHIESPLYANVFEDATKYLSMDSVTVKPMVSEPADVPLCVYSQSDRKMKITEPMSVQVKVANKPEALGSLSRRRLKMKLKADDAPLCIYSNSAGENDVKENKESEALGSLSLRKLRTEFNEIVAVAQENGVKEGKKSSVPLDALSLRQLRLKLKETLNAQNQKNGEPTRVPLGRLDANAY